MASPTKKVKIRRKLRQAALGKRRKNAAAQHGTTQRNLPLDQPNAFERSVKGK